MVGQRPLEPKTDKKALDQTVVISLQEFLRTRDSVSHCFSARPRASRRSKLCDCFEELTFYLQVVSGLNTLVGVIHELNNAYVKHTGDLLTAAGVSPEILTQYAVNYMSLPPKSSLLTGGLNALNPDVKIKKKRVKKEKDPNAPKRPLTAFFLYSTYARPEVRKQLPDEATPVAVNDEILKRWKEMPAEEKEVILDSHRRILAGTMELTDFQQTWKEKYEENNRRYKIEVAAYKTKTGVDPDAAEHHEEAEEVEEEAEEGAGEADEEEGEDEDEEEEEPVKPPTPPPTKAKKAKAAKGKAKENGAPAVSSPSPSAQLRAPAEVSSPAKKADKKRKTDKDAEEPKKKKTKAEEKELSSPLASKDKKKKRKGEA